MISIFDRVENIVRKGENAGYQHFLHFSQCFQKGFFFSVVKKWDCVVKSYVNIIRTPFRETAFPIRPSPQILFLTNVLMINLL